jgi:hypothetical protein
MHTHCFAALAPEIEMADKKEVASWFSCPVKLARLADVE